MAIGNSVERFSLVAILPEAEIIRVRAPRTIRVDHFMQLVRVSRVWVDPDMARLVMIAQ